jgi:hypothetical protein
MCSESVLISQYELLFFFLAREKIHLDSGLNVRIFCMVSVCKKQAT